MTPLNSPHRAFSPERHANFRFPQTRAAVLWGGGVGWGAMTFAFLAHMLDATQLFLAHMLDAKLFLAHMFDATQLVLAHMLDATQVVLAHMLDATQLYKHGCPLDRCLINISVADDNL